MLLPPALDRDGAAALGRMSVVSIWTSDADASTLALAPPEARNTSGLAGLARRSQRSCPYLMHALPAQEVQSKYRAGEPLVRAARSIIGRLEVRVLLAPPPIPGSAEISRRLANRADLARFARPVLSLQGAFAGEEALSGLLSLP